MNRRTPRGLLRRAARPAPAFAFCEPVSATAESLQHIRTVGPEGRKPGGGVPNPALCGRDLAHGWDLTVEVTPESVTALSQPRPGDRRVFLCAACAERYLGHTPGAAPTT